MALRRGKDLVRESYQDGDEPIIEVWLPAGAWTGPMREAVAAAANVNDIPVPDAAADYRLGVMAGHVTRSLAPVLDRHSDAGVVARLDSDVSGRPQVVVTLSS